MKNLTYNDCKFINGGNDWIGQCHYEESHEPNDDPSSYYGDGSPYYKYGTFLGKIALLGFSLTTFGRLFK